jgi:hypothetical protein
MNKKIVISVLTLALAGSAIMAVRTSAQGIFSGDNFISTLAQKFGKSEDEVKTVFDEVRNERQAEMQTQQEDRLTQAVTDGNLTEDQKQLILAKKAELQTERQADRQMRQTHQQELKTWADDLGIDTQYLFGFGQGMGNKAGGRGFGSGCAM